MKIKHIALLLLLLLGSYAFSQEVRNTSKTNEFRLGLKTGRTFFTNPEELGGESDHVFYGQLALDYGLCRADKIYYGMGIGAEYIDLLDVKVSIPIHVDLRYYFIGDIHKGAFLDVQAGYVFCNDQTFPIKMMDDGQEIMIGQTVRKLSGPYGEIFFGYRFHQFDFQVGYGYRVVHYNRNYMYHPYPLDTSEKNFFKPLYTVMAGVSYTM